MKFTLFFVIIYILFYYDVSGQVRKTGMSLADRVQQLTDMTNMKAVLKFNANKFTDYVKSTPRNYSVIVLFTAMSPHRQCMICNQAYDEFGIVANSFRYSQVYSNKLFFAVVDYDESPDVFTMVKLTTAPAFVHFPPKGKPKTLDHMDIQRTGLSADSIAKWINERTDTNIRVFRPPNYSGAMAFIVLLTLVASILYLRRNNLEFLYEKNMWATGAMFFCFAMVSGQVWNSIRRPPFVHKGQHGEIAYIHGSSQGQFVFETYIIMVLNGAISLGVILLTESGNKKRDSQQRKILAIVGLILISVFFSLILSVFRSKIQGYPYSFIL